MADSLAELLSDVSKQLSNKIQHGVDSGLIEIDIDGERVIFPKQGKNYEFKGERIVQAALYVELVAPKYDYHYPAENIDFEATVPRREVGDRSDMIIYVSSDQEYAFAAIEVEATSEISMLDEARREGLGKASGHGADWLITACGEDTRYFHFNPAPASVSSIEDYREPSFPKRYGEPVDYQYGSGDEYLDLNKVEMNELQRRFKRCHDQIWEGGKLDPAQAFDEMSKFIFAKISDEIYTELGEHYGFQEGRNEDAETVADRVKGLYDEAAEDEPDVFSDGIEASDVVIRNVVRILQDVSLEETDLDAKGQAFETFLGRMFKGEYGQYFTPRKIVRFMVSVVDPGAREKCIDPAAGSGGFLLYSMDHVNEGLEDKYADETRRRDIFRDFSRDGIYGVEINERIARVAMMNMVLHGDGHTNIDAGKMGLVDSIYTTQRSALMQILSKWFLLIHRLEAK